MNPAEKELSMSDRISYLTSAYLAPVSYYKQIVRSRQVLIEQHDNYIKQTYRNRCRIASANGVMDLTIPVRKGETKSKTKDIRISYTENWQQIHWRAIESAYRSSPFFEYYQDDLYPFFQTKKEFLIDWNCELQNVMFNLLDITTPITYTTQYADSFSEESADLRDFFHPKKEYDGILNPYYQVFESKFGFQRDVSIIDLLFNKGPESVFFL